MPDQVPGVDAAQQGAPAPSVTIPLPAAVAKVEQEAVHTIQVITGDARVLASAWHFWLGGMGIGFAIGLLVAHGLHF